MTMMMSLTMNTDDAEKRCLIRRVLCNADWKSYTIFHMVSLSVTLNDL